MILPVSMDMTMVAAEREPPTTARDDAMTVIRGGCVADGMLYGNDGEVDVELLWCYIVNCPQLIVSIYDCAVMSTKPCHHVVLGDSKRVRNAMSIWTKYQELKVLLHP